MVCRHRLGEPAVSSIADLGVDLDHFVNLATPGEDWLRVASILIESFDIILVDPGFAPSASERARLLAKIRERRMSLISLRPMSGSTEQIEITDTRWSGAAHGRGRLQSCLVRARSQTEPIGSCCRDQQGLPPASPRGRWKWWQTGDHPPLPQRPLRSPAWQPKRVPFLQRFLLYLLERLLPRQRARVRTRIRIRRTILGGRRSHSCER